MNDYKERVHHNFNTIDNILSKISKNSQIYWFLFSIRTEYSVVDELKIRNGNITLFSELRNIIRVFFLIMLYPYVEMTTICKKEAQILGNHRLDKKLSSKSGIPNFIYKKSIKLPSSSKIKNLFSFFILFFKILRTPLDKRKLLRCVPGLLEFSKFYNEIDLNNIKTLIFEDDLNAIHVAILLRAKLININRVKIEYFHIDFLQHNNVFGDYYFYPSTLHRKIREKSSYNKKLKYVEGGFLNTEVLDASDKKDIKRDNIITYFTCHSDLFIYNDLFYINKILEMLPIDSTLNVKVHPNEDYQKYCFLLADDRVKLYKFGMIENKDLIIKSSVCISILSSVSLEAKFICNNSYFINYSFDGSNFAEDYLEIQKYFDIISSDEILSQVLYNKYNAVSLNIFKQNVNMTHPDTLRIFKAFIHTLNTNQIDN